MVNNSKSAKGFTLIELMVVIAIIAGLGALILPALSRAKSKAQRSVCMSNLHEISLGVRMYAEDSSEAFPPVGYGPPATFTAYTLLMKSYVGLTGTQPERAKIFACPADRFYWDYDKGWISQSLHHQEKDYYSSYGFNGGNFLIGRPPAPRWPGIAGRKLSSIKDPVKTVLVIEFAALLPYSWHNPVRISHYNNARDMAGCFCGWPCQFH